MRILALAAALYFLADAGSASGRTIYVIANANAPVAKLSQQELEQIYLLRQSYWPDGALIVPVNREASSDLRAFFSTIVLKQPTASLSTYWNQMHFRGKSPPVVQSSRDAVIAFVRKIPGAIGYVEDVTGMTDVKIVAELP